jgi:hypothetical protein
VFVEKRRSALGGVAAFCLERSSFFRRRLSSATLRRLPATFLDEPKFTDSRPMVSLAEKHALERAKRAKLESSARDPHSNIHGVLLSDEIELYVQNCNLIDPFDRANLKPAAYELTVGDEYFISGEFLTLESAGKENSKIIIPPFEVAVLKNDRATLLASIPNRTMEHPGKARLFWLALGWWPTSRPRVCWILVLPHL